MKDESPEEQVNRAAVPFVACGDLSGFDSDRSYPVDRPAAGAGEGSAAAPLEPVQKPINPPYQEAMERRRRAIMQANGAPPE